MLSSHIAPSYGEVLLEEISTISLKASVVEDDDVDWNRN